MDNYLSFDLTEIKIISVDVLTYRWTVFRLIICGLGCRRTEVIGRRWPLDAPGGQINSNTCKHPGDLAVDPKATHTFEK